MKILVTGGLGYIGSHITVELLDKNFSVIVVDNLINSKIDVLAKIKKITNNHRLEYFNIDIRDATQLEKIFIKIKIDCVIHCAGLKIIPESINKPSRYYDYNLNGTRNLCYIMDKHGVRNLIFSSSASVYDPDSNLPIKELNKLLPYNVYGRTKLFSEYLLNDFKNTKKGWKIIALRYFNPVGAHSSGVIGETPLLMPTNLLPIISLVAIGKLKKINVFGKNHNTKDGTAIRDFIHVVDLAKGHVKALDFVTNSQHDNYMEIINLGSGKGYSVFEMIQTFEKITKVKIPYDIKPRREGDISVSFADVSYAKNIIDWQTKLSLEEICSDQWNFMIKNKKYFK